MDEQKPRRAKPLFDLLQTLCVALVVIVLVFTFAFRMVDVHGSSMEGTLSNGERLVLSCFSYTPAYGDIVVIERGEDTEPLIKRVIGLEGDTLRIDAETGTVYRNEQALEEPYITAATAVEQMDGAITVPAGQVFVMGDNRAPGCSLDSRTFGCVAADRIVGKAVFRLLPLSRLGGLGDDQ